MRYPQPMIMLLGFAEEQASTVEGRAGGAGEGLSRRERGGIRRNKGAERHQAKGGRHQAGRSKHPSLPTGIDILPYFRIFRWTVEQSLC